MSSIGGTDYSANASSISLQQWDLVEDESEHDQSAIYSVSSTGLVQINDGDIVIVVLGPSGSGKSNFINIVAGRQVAPVGADLNSCTREVCVYRCEHPDERGRYVILVDTPGLDDSDRTDFDVLNEITRWLHKSYQLNILLSGVIQLHNIAERRMRGPEMRCLRTLRDLCGTAALTNLVMLTTFWDLVDTDVAIMREAELIAKFWKEHFITEGAFVRRLRPYTRSRAWEIINLFQTGARVKPLQVQEEMGRDRRQISETSVFKSLLRYWKSAVDAMWGENQSQSSNSPIDIAQTQRQFDALDRERSRGERRRRLWSRFLRRNPPMPM